MPIQPLTPQGYSPSDTKQALYAGSVDATVINLHDNGAASRVGGEIKLAVNLDARSVRGEIGNFKGGTDAANFLNAGTIKVAAELNRSRLGLTGSAVFTPAAGNATVATGSFTGLLDTRSAAGSSVFVPGNLAQGSIGLASSDFQMLGSWRANLVPPPKR